MNVPVVRERPGVTVWKCEWGMLHSNTQCEWVMLHWHTQCEWVMVHPHTQCEGVMLYSKYICVQPHSQPRFFALKITIYTLYSEARGMQGCDWLSVLPHPPFPFSPPPPAPSSCLSSPSNVARRDPCTHKYTHTHTFILRPSSHLRTPPQQNWIET